MDSQESMGGLKNKDNSLPLSMISLSKHSLHKGEGALSPVRRNHPLRDVGQGKEQSAFAVVANQPSMNDPCLPKTVFGNGQ